MPCCPRCAFGSQWSDLIDKGDRQAAWLVVLLRRRGGPDDVRRIRSLEFDYEGARDMVRHLDDQVRLKEISRQNKPPRAVNATA